MRSFPILLFAMLCCRGDGAVSTDRPEPQDSSAIRVEVAVEGLESPVFLTAPPGDDRLFILEQAGRIRIARNARLASTPFLDISDRVGSGGERGLLGMAFHPRFAENRYFYVDYTDANGDTRIERYTVSSDADRADRASAKLILGVDQPYANHNGGMIAFGPDGKLYIGMGDGGSGGDPHGNGQNIATLLGAILRLDVDAGDPYAIPADNPYAGRADARGEIWAIGVRNPWRFAFDPEGGTIYIADVGQNSWEEVNARPAAAAGLNYGWNIMEGLHCFGRDACDRNGLVLPVVEYSHDEGCSITGGYVYRGAAIPAIRGLYFYSDWCSGWLRSFRLGSDGTATERKAWPIGDIGRVLSFGVDGRGELYVLSDKGRAYRIVAAK